MPHCTDPHCTIVDPHVHGWVNDPDHPGEYISTTWLVERSRPPDWLREVEPDRWSITDRD